MPPWINERNERASVVGKNQGGNSIPQAIGFGRGSSVIRTVGWMLAGECEEADNSIQNFGPEADT